MCLSVTPEGMTASGRLVSELTWVLVSQGEQLSLPGGELSDVSLHLGSDILQALGDGRQTLCAPDARGRDEESLHAGHLSRDSPQLVEA